MPRRDELAAPATQIVADRDDYLGQGRHDIGRRLANDQVELFVAGDAAAALLREFELHAPEFIALHDIGGSTSLRLLSGLAATSGAQVQRLMVRRQGHGVALAVLQFVESRRADGAVVRLYSTDVNADGATRAALAKVLLGWSRLGVLLLGDLPGHALGAALAPLHEAIARGPWPNRELLVVPLGASSAAAAQTSALAAGTPVQVHITPQAGKPQQVWDFVSGAWNRQRAPHERGHALETEVARALPRPPVPSPEATTEPMPLGIDAAPAARRTPDAGPRAMPVPGATSWQHYVERCAAIKGALAVCVFDLHSKLPLAACGGPPAAARLAEQGATMLAAAADALRALGLGSSREELAVSTVDHHLLLRPVPGHPGVALQLVLAAGPANPMLARMQLERIEPPH
ncbi:MAG: hypothetical protein U1F07_08500 [Rubrivivax sp.]